MAEFAWWMRGILYEIYPRSFQDSDDDGVGDLRGICQRLDYLTWLGIDAIWIAPIYPSPMADFGYDVSDYCGIDPLYGSLSDFEQLLKEAHARGLKIILDFVPNHTSNRHPWFEQSRSSRSNPKRDWYIWQDGKPGGAPPNNWVSQFGGSAWAFDAATDQYYLHSFLPEQPDLNWRNPSVRDAMYDALRFWLDRGVDGFRVDVLWLLIKDAGYRDNPPNPNYRHGDAEINRYMNINNGDQPEVHRIVAEMRAILDRYGDRVLIGEIYLPLERLVSYYGNGLEAQLPFNFQLIKAPWNATKIAQLVNDYEKALPATGWPNWVLGNHDQPRIAARVGESQARVAAMLLLTLRGTPTMYYGDELGIGRVEIPPEMVQDPWEKREAGLGLGRDPSRTPLPWNGSQNAGFTKGPPWLPLNPDYRLRNVEVLEKNPTSILCLYKRLIELRRHYRALNVGAFRSIAVGDDFLAYERDDGDERIRVWLNFSGESHTVSAANEYCGGSILLSTYLDREGPVSELTLRPNEGVIIRAAAAHGNTTA